MSTPDVVQFKLKFTVRGQHLSVFAPRMASDTIGYFIALGEFSPEWDGTVRWLHLKAPSGTTYDIPFDSDNRTAALNFTAGHWEAWIHGNDLTENTPELRIVTDVVSFEIPKSGMTGAGPFPPVPASAVEQIASNAAQALAVSTQLEQDYQSVVALARNSAAQAEQSSQQAEEQANQAAASAGQAGQAAAAVLDMEVAAETGAQAAVEKQVAPETGAVRLQFTLPRGETGAEGKPGAPGPKGDPGSKDMLAEGSLTVRMGRDAMGPHFEW